MSQTSPTASMSRRSFFQAAAGAAATVGAGAALSGCKASTGSSSSGSTTITVMYSSSDFTKDHIAAFEKQNPGYTIEFIEFDATRLNAMLTADNAPDFARGYPSANSCARGLYAPIDEYLDSSTVISKSDLLAINDGFRWDGTQLGSGSYYGLVKDWSEDNTLWQNTKLLEEAGLDPLSATEAVSWDDLTSMGEKMTVRKNGKTKVFGLGVEWSWGVAEPIQLMILQQGGSYFNADFTESDFTTPEAQRALQWFVDLGTKAIAPTSLNPLPDGSDQSTFMAGRMGITQDGYWFGGNFAESKKSLQDVVRMAPAPTFGQRITASYGATGGFIPAKSKKKDLGWKVMEFFMGGDPAVERAKSGWGLPALQSLWDYLPAELDYQKEALTTAQAELDYFQTLPSSPYLAQGVIDPAIDDALTAVLRGKSTVAEAGQSITDTVNKALAQGKDQLG